MTPAIVPFKSLPCHREIAILAQDIIEKSEGNERGIEYVAIGSAAVLALSDCHEILTDWSGDCHLGTPGRNRTCISELKRNALCH